MEDHFLLAFHLLFLADGHLIEDFLLEIELLLADPELKKRMIRFFNLGHDNRVNGSLGLIVYFKLFYCDHLLRLVRIVFLVVKPTYFLVLTIRYAVQVKQNNFLRHGGNQRNIQVTNTVLLFV